MKTRHFLFALLWSLLFAASARAALEPALVEGLASSNFSQRIAAIESLASTGERGLPIVEALEQGRFGMLGEQPVYVLDGQVIDLASGQALAAAPNEVSTVRLNNRQRRAAALARAGITLETGSQAERLNAARTLVRDASEPLLPLFERVLENEEVDQIRELVLQAAARVNLASSEPERRIHAVQLLGSSADAAVLTMLRPFVSRDGDNWIEPNAEVREAAEASIKRIERRLAITDSVRTVFFGLSLGSILLLAALGLAITFGVMGVINMAHGELLMIGAYATFVVQGLFRTHLPEYFDLYVVAAIPVAFLVAALFGVLMERSVLRYLYGRPLESLLATWGISLILIQTARVSFGPQNLELTNPSWMSGSVEVMAGLSLPWNRIIILGFSVFVLLLIWLMMQRTRLGMFVRAVTQNRQMAGCVGVPTARVDTLAFAIGAGVAGLGGLALSQIANVGPAMGQGYIVDSFMVVVLGGVGQLAGAVSAAFGLGIFSKLLEGWTGAVIAKILVLVFIIIFIQKRPQGIFALKGRSVD